MLTDAQKLAFLVRRAELLEKAEAGQVITVFGVSLLVHVNDCGKYTTKAPKATVVVLPTSQAA